MLLWKAGIIQLVVDNFVVLFGFQVRDHLPLEPLIPPPCALPPPSPNSAHCSVGSPRKQKMYFDHLPITRRAEAHAMVLYAQFCADYVQLFSYLVPYLWIGIIEQALGSAPNQVAAGPENI